MNRLSALLLLPLLSVLLPTPPAWAGEATLPRAVVAAQQAVVRIHVVETDYVGGRETKHELFGSGVVISAEGHVLTNHHVAGKGKYFACTLANRDEVPAVLVGTDALTDLAVLRLTPPVPRTFAHVGFGDSGAIRVGDRVFAMGSPLAFDQSVTSGVVSNTALSKSELFPDELFILDGEDLGAVLRWIAHDAEIFPGNSGGPLMNTRGKIIGINEMSFGLSGAIPGNLARDVAASLIATGGVPRSWAGFSVQPLLASSPRKHGVLITGALRGSPAETAGFRTGDILLSLGGKAVDVQLRQELPAFNLYVMSLPTGKPVAARVWRDGKEHCLTLVPAARPKATPAVQEMKAWGCCVSEMTLMQRQERTGTGVLISGVRGGGPADHARPALQADDLITAVNGTPVTSAAELTTATQALLATATGEVTALVTFQRRDETLHTVVTFNRAAVADLGREIRKAWLPINVQVLTRELAQAMRLETAGVIVTRLYPHPDAQALGLRVGDVITALDGEALDVNAPEDAGVLSAMIGHYPIGAAITLTVLRDGAARPVPLTLTAAPEPPQAMARYGDAHFEFQAREIAFKDRLGHAWESEQRGVLVDAVGEGGWAALGRLQQGDLILAINGEAVVDTAGLRGIMQRTAEQRTPHLTVLVLRGQRRIFLEWRVDWAR
jgi:serine protease Do